MSVGRVAVTYVCPEWIYESIGNRYAAHDRQNLANYREDTATRLHLKRPEAIGDSVNLLAKLPLQKASLAKSFPCKKGSLAKTFTRKNLHLQKTLPSKKASP
jgi:hypothetical protein